MSEENKKTQEKVSEKSPVAKREEEVLEFWRKNNIFKKTLEKPAPKGEYVFYDGPPFATGLPHYGHILASAIKDAVPRYQTMQGKKVERRWGWDCHGLPIENIVEKDLKISGKKQIEEYGVEKFNEYARSKVLTYVHDWKKTVERIGRWVDFDGSYKTMDNTFMESVWWAFKEVAKKKLIYEGTRVLPYCPRCETPIANSEIAMDNSYKDISDISAYVKFELKEKADGEKTYVLAWTTTPWTLPGNFALAVNPKIKYVEVSVAENPGRYILAKDRLSVLKKEFKIEKEFSGKELVGKSYEPPFDYFKNADFKNKNKAWKIYGADFVTTTDGTGVVHIAPGYGEDDMELAKKEGIPFIHHVGIDGKFKPEIIDLAGIPVKPKDDHQSADVLIIKKLATDGKLFAKEKITHSYPHCYRCETPLFYYAIPAWFIKISEVKKKILKSNEKINWIPAHLKEGRYAKSVEGAPDWNISRNRYWASPLPIWKCDSCKETEFVGSIDELKKRASRGNKYFLMRHGQAENNIKYLASGDPKLEHHLTDEGKKQVEASAKKLKKEKIDVIFFSPMMRTKETAEITAEVLGLEKNSVIEDARLAEPNMGIFNGADFGAYISYFSSLNERFVKAPEGGENYSEVKNRLGDFIYDIDEKYFGKKILVVTHEVPAWLLVSAAEGKSGREAALSRGDEDEFMANAEIRKLDFSPIPHNKNYELDLHRPYSDRIVFPCKCGKGTMRRIPEVIDCWFESGSMPFASAHFPFENEKWFKSHFPADFVSEYIAQTRTWFYYTHAVSEIIFGGIPFKNIVTTGTVLAEDGQKMSKSKGNFPDPWIVFDRYGVDALRFYLLSSPLMKSEDLNFCERDVDAVYKKIILRLGNVVSFYEMYGDGSKEISGASENVLDKWILARLAELSGKVTDAMERSEIDKAASPIEKFIDDLSTWYLRRSRERLKNGNEKEKSEALSTARKVLAELSKIMAPFVPFVAESVYQKIKAGGIGGKSGAGELAEKESVHLEDWPKFAKLGKADSEILGKMEVLRKIVEVGLSLRAEKGIKVRQPLAEVVYEISEKEKAGGLAKEFENIIADELNVKKVRAGKVGKTDGENFGGVKVSLDWNITPELEEEGNVREFVRFVQDLRKKWKLDPKEKIALEIETGESGKKFVERNLEALKKATLSSGISFGPVQDGEQSDIGGLNFKIGSAEK